MAILFFFFFSLLNGFFDKMGDLWLSFLGLRLKLLSSKIFYRGFLMASFITLYKLFVIGNALDYLPEYEGGRKLALALTLMVFCTSSFQLFRSWPHCSI